MHHNRLKSCVGPLLSLLAVSLLLAGLWATRAALGQWLWILAGAALAAAAGALCAWLWPRLDDERLGEMRRRYEEQLDAFAKRETELETTRQVWQAELTRQVEALQVREKEFSARLVTFHEWMEFPQPVQLEARDEGPSAIRELVARDRQMLELLRIESEKLFEAVRDNKYVVDGRFQPLMLRDDAWEIAHRVARIYRPDSEQPLLETTPELIFRAVSRMSLQFLVALDQLPLNVKELNLNALYQYVRKAVKAYDVYKSVEPYWGYVNSAFYLGRLALGANPLSLGAWWVVANAGKMGAEAVTQHVVNRQAVALMQNLVRVIGFEVASLYGGNFRHRDANWIYAVELVELVHSFPPARDSLHGALRELGALQLRSEYDRVFLYRCVAAHASPDPERYEAATCLTMEERRAIANRLELALKTWIRGRAGERLKKWHAAVEARLQIKLTAVGETPQSEADQRRDALRSLASFLVAIKVREDDLVEQLRGTKLAALTEPDALEPLLELLAQTPPQFFEHTDLDPGSPLVSVYLADLVDLAANLPPRAPAIDELLAEAALHLQQDPKEVRRRFENSMQTRVASRWQSGVKPRKLAMATARVVLDLLTPDERLWYVYEDVTLQPPALASPLPSANALCLVGTSTRLVLIETGELPRVLWSADASVRWEKSEGLLFHDAVLRGGVSQFEPAGVGAIVVPGAKLSSFDAHFGPLLTHLRQLGTASRNATESTGKNS